MNPLEIVIDLFLELFSPIKKAWLRWALQFISIPIFMILYLVLFTQIANLIPLFVKNKYAVVILDALLFVLIAVVFYIVLFLLSRMIHRKKRGENDSEC